MVIGKANANAKPLICLYRFDCEIIRIEKKISKFIEHRARRRRGNILSSV